MSNRDFDLIIERVQRKAGELGIVDRQGRSLLPDQVMELIAAFDGERSSHALRAAQRRKPRRATAQATGRTDFAQWVRDRHGVTLAQMSAEQHKQWSLEFLSAHIGRRMARIVHVHLRCEDPYAVDADKVGVWEVAIDPFVPPKHVANAALDAVAESVPLKVPDLFEITVVGLDGAAIDPDFDLEGGTLAEKALVTRKLSGTVPQTKAQPRIVAQFQPKDLQGDEEIDAEPLGETEFDVTDMVLANFSPEAALSIRDGDASTTYMRYALTAPGWIKAWDGPFSISVQASIANYFKARA